VRKLKRATTWVNRVPESFEPRNRPLAVGRSLLAIAELSVLLFTSDDVLFLNLLGSSSGMQCGGVRAISLWCVAGSENWALLASRTVAIAVLCIVASGFRPRWTCIPHWYVTFSLTSSIVPSNGGDHAAQVVTMLLVPVCLGDERVWQWRHATQRMSPGWQGSALASQLAIRVQVFVIYAVAVGSKLADPAWRSGRALYIVTYDPVFGPPPSIRHFFDPVVDSFWVMAVATWMVIVVQALIALAAFLGQRARLCALIMGGCLHLAIIIWLGLPSFGLVMITVLLIAYGGPPLFAQGGHVTERQSGRTKSHDEDGSLLTANGSAS
jgi:sporulation delaying protein B